MGLKYGQDGTKTTGRHPIDSISKSAATLEINKVLELVAARTITPMAQQAIYDTEFMDDPAAISHQLEIVSTFRRVLDDGKSLPLESFEDHDSIFQKLVLRGVALSGEQLSNIAGMSQIARRVRAFTASHSEPYPHIARLGQHLTALRELEEQIKAAIDPADFSILDSASPELRRIRRSMTTTIQKVRKHLMQVSQSASSKDLLQEQLITIRDGRLVLMVKDEHRKKIKGIVHDQSASGQTLFVEPVQTVEMNNQVRQLEAEEREEIHRILTRLSEHAQLEYDTLQQNYAMLIEMDAYAARATFSRTFGCAAAQVNRSGTVILYKARHPLLLAKNDDPESVVPLSLKLGITSRCIIITGPNAGGKTVAMKTIGLAVLMTRLGLHIPASADSEIGIMGTVFVDIGDQQSIENDLSTFTSHMRNLRTMLDNASQHDLIFIDEMGSGTDPDEGAALAIAMLRHFIRREVNCIITTHHSALKTFAHETDGIENGSMIFNTETLEPTYQFRAGIPGSSYAFEIAHRIGLKKELLDRARHGLGAEKGRIENLIVDLESKLKQQDTLISSLKLEETRLAGLVSLYKERSEKLRTEERKLKKQALLDSEAILARANKTLEETVRSIREQQAGKESIIASKQKIEKEKTRIQQEKEKIAHEEKRQSKREKQHASTIEAGKQALWRPGNSHVHVLEPPDAQGRVHIQAGSFKMRVDLSELQPLADAPKNKRRVVHLVSSEKVKQEYDIRGMRAEEAVTAIDRYLSEAVLSGWDFVRIIHGKGTGALRKAIAEYLKTHPHVGQHGPAKLGRGDIGVTEVKFR